MDEVFVLEVHPTRHGFVNESEIAISPYLALTTLSQIHADTCRARLKAGTDLPLRYTTQSKQSKIVLPQRFGWPRGSKFAVWLPERGFAEVHAGKRGGQRDGPTRRLPNQAQGEVVVERSNRCAEARCAPAAGRILPTRFTPGRQSLADLKPSGPSVSSQSLRRRWMKYLY